MKNKDGKSSKGPLDPAQMLASLFTDKPAREPFDDVRYSSCMYIYYIFSSLSLNSIITRYFQRKVMIKLRQVLNPEDFAGLFKDPMIGDIY
jgi:hypothetical protein